MATPSFRARSASLDGRRRRSRSSSDTRKKKKLKHYFKKRHQVHCSIPKDDDAFESRRHLYQEFVFNQPNVPPFLPYARTVRHCFKLTDSSDSESTSTVTRTRTPTPPPPPPTPPTTQPTPPTPPTPPPTPPPDPPKKTLNQETQTQPMPPPADPTTIMEKQMIYVVEKDLSTPDQAVEPPPPADNAPIMTKLDQIYQHISVAPPSTPTDASKCVHVISEEKILNMKLEILQKLEIIEKLRVNNHHTHVERIKLDEGCLCHRKTFDTPAYIWYENPQEKFCPKCCLVEHGKNLLSLSRQMSPDGSLPPCLGRMILCLETDNDVTLRQVLDFLHSDGEADPNYRPVYQPLIYMGCVWGAHRCVRLLLYHIGMDEDAIEGVLPKEGPKEGGSNNGGNTRPSNDGPGTSALPPPPPNTFINNINILNNIHKLINQSDKPKGSYYGNIFVAARALSEQGVNRFQALLKKPVDVTEPEPEPAKYADKRIIIHELIDLDYKCSKLEPSEARVKRGFVMAMLEIFYQIPVIDRWKTKVPGIERVSRETNFSGGKDAEQEEHKEDHIAALSYTFSRKNEEKINWIHPLWGVALGCWKRCQTRQFYHVTYTWTPLQFAANRGTPEVIEQILERPPYKVKVEGSHWYCVDEVDTVLSGNNQASILDLLQRRTPVQEGANILLLEPLKTLVADKWTRYRRVYTLWVLSCLIYMTIYTLCALTRPLNAESLSEMYQTAPDFARFVGEIIVILGLFGLMYCDIQDLRNKRYYFPLPWKRLGLYRITNILFVVFTVIAVFFRIFSVKDEDTVLALALFCGWMNMIHRLAAFKPMGMFPIIMHHAVVGDLLPGFIWVYILFLTALSTATFTAYQTAIEEQEDFPNSTFFRTPHSLFKLTFGLLDTGYELESRFKALGIALFIFYLVYGNIILFNVLIAMVCNTYTKIFDEVDQHWIKIQLGYALLMESWFPFLKHDYIHSREKNVFYGKTRGKYFIKDDKHYIELPDHLEASIDDVVEGEVHLM